MKKLPHALNVSLHGLSDRMQKMMVTYLEVTCNGIASVVDESDAEVEIIDVDSSATNNLLEQRLAQQPAKPIIVTSLNEVPFDNIIYVKKPLKIPTINKAIKKAKKQLNKSKIDPFSDTAIVSKKVTKLKLLDTSRQKKTVQNKRYTREIVHLITEDKDNHDHTLAGLDNTSSTLNGFDHTSSAPKPSILTIESKQNKFKVKKKSPIIENKRSTIRYGFNPIDALLKKDILLNLKDDLSVMVLNLSGKGAIIELSNPSNLHGKVTLIIKFDPQNFFSISARIVRKESNNTYGLKFLDDQHDLSDYLINSGQFLHFM